MTSQFDSIWHKALPIARRFSFAFGVVAATVCTPASAQVRQSDRVPGSASVAETGIFPPAYRGKWAPSVADCADAESIHQAFIHANGIDADEGIGRLRQTTRGGRARSVHARLTWGGDGQFWDRSWTLTLNPAGNRLTVMMDEAEVADTYVKCPQS